MTQSDVTLFNYALSFAAEAHKDQRRKGRGIPYIVHPMEVASIIASLTTDVKVMIAGLLHDVVEDAGVLPDEVREKFGDRVAELVASETENKRPDRPAVETWRLRKEESLVELADSKDIGIKILWLGDKLSNIRSLYADYKEIGDKVFEKFNQKDKKEHAWYYEKIAECLAELKDTAAYEEYALLVNKVFGEVII